MTEDPTLAKLTGDNFVVFGEIITRGDETYLPIKVDVTPKGVKSITLWLDEFIIDETGTREKEKDGKKIPVGYMKFKLLK